MWKTVKLGDVCDLVGGGTPSKKNDDYYDGDIPWATVRDMNVEELTSTEHKITELGLKNSSSKVIPANNVIIASRVGLGKVCILRQDTAINQDLRGVIPKRENEIDKSFLFYWFKGIANKIIGAGRGATVQGVTLPFLNSLSFPLPPLAEQQRIVAKLDAAFAEIDGAIKTVEKNVKNSKLIFQTLRNEIYQKVADTAPNVELETIAKLSRGHNPPKSKFIDIPKDGYVRFYQIRDAKSDKFATYVPDDSKLHKVTERDFLMNAYRYVGEVFRGVSGAFNVALCKLAIIDFEKVNEDYLYYMIPSHLIKGELLKTSARSLIPSMSVKELAKLKVPIPSFEEQKEISRKIIDLEKQQIVLLNIYKKKLYQLNYLKAALLAQELQSEAA